MADEPEPQEPVDFIAVLRGKIPDLHGYDEYAIDQYVGLSFYIAQREAGMPQAQAAELTCAQHGHDAPRGLCQRCGLGVELGASKDEKEERRQRVAERDRWLASRLGEKGR
jgi:hypothetical protein